MLIRDIYIFVNAYVLRKVRTQEAYMEKERVKDWVNKNGISMILNWNTGWITIHFHDKRLTNLEKWKRLFKCEFSKDQFISP